MSQQVEQLLTQLDQETDLLALETVVQTWSHAVGRRTLMSVVPTVTAQYALTTLPCVCSADGQYQRRRAAQVLTSMGPVTYQRAYYVCLACHQGWCPLDAQLGWCAGSVSRILQEHIAVVAAQLPFAQTADVLHRLWGIPLSATTCQSIAEQVGPWLHAHASEGVGEPLGDTVYVSMDGTMTHDRDEGWKEIRVESVYTTTPHREEIRAVQHSSVVDRASVESLADRLWHEFRRRGGR